MLFFLAISLLLTALDFASKRWVVAALSGGREITLLPGFLKLIYGENTGAAFGILPAARWFLILVGIVVLLGVLWYIKKERSRSRWQYNGLIFIFAGALGNLIDRIFYGFVIDFINLPHWPTFNLADVFIDIGVACLLVYLAGFSGKEN
ncbi:lipoprotein signal peptidase [Candidatus Termititenax persephonae]|uniref:Lipoprotein signal peptidase n=1 Tax=Candidatus Termititenax persephonae TaxID=2218525 RepID=A0A388THK2_9BACT|nr:lipoprotein signal peptidase [Candidatus Termititenax persephonae]